MCWFRCAWTWHRKGRPEPTTTSRSQHRGSGHHPCAVAVPPRRRAVEVCASTQIGRQPEDEMVEHELVAWQSHGEPSESASQILHVSSRMHSPSGCVAVGGADARERCIEQGVVMVLGWRVHARPLRSCSRAGCASRRGEDPTRDPTRVRLRADRRTVPLLCRKRAYVKC